nr:unnamed protein product [Callosobruchus analis]
MGPKFEELAEKYPMIVMLAVDVDECEDIALEYRISSMPTFVLVRNKRVVATFSGANAERLRHVIERHLKDNS